MTNEKPFEENALAPAYERAAFAQRMARLKAERRLEHRRELVRPSNRRPRPRTMDRLHHAGVKGPSQLARHPSSISQRALPALAVFSDRIDIILRHDQPIGLRSRKQLARDLYASRDRPSSRPVHQIRF